MNRWKRSSFLVVRSLKKEATKSQKRKMRLQFFNDKNDTCSCSCTTQTSISGTDKKRLTAKWQLRSEDEMKWMNSCANVIAKWNWTFFRNWEEKKSHTKKLSFDNFPSFVSLIFRYLFRSLFLSRFLESALFMNLLTLCIIFRGKNRIKAE